MSISEFFFFNFFSICLISSFHFASLSQSFLSSLKYRHSIVIILILLNSTNSLKTEGHLKISSLSILKCSRVCCIEGIWRSCMKISSSLSPLQTSNDVSLNFERMANKRVSSKLVLFMSLHRVNKIENIIFKLSYWKYLHI